MKRRSLVRISLGVGLLLCLTAFPATLLAEGPEVMNVKVLLAPLQMNHPVTFQFNFLPITWDEEGNVVLRNGEFKSLRYDPASSADLQFSVTMRVGAQYQLVIDVLDSAGNLLNEGIAYYYDSGEEANLAVSPGGKTTLKLSLSPQARVANRANFLDVWSQTKTDVITVTLYSAPDIAIAAMEKT